GQEIHVLDEIFLKPGTTVDACKVFLERYGKHQAVKIYGDASGYQKQTTGTTDYELVKEYLQSHSNLRVSFEIPKSNPRVKERVNLMNRKLRNVANETELFVDRRCNELILDFQEVSYKKAGTEIDKDRDRNRTHLSDALGYLLCGVCGTSEPTIGFKNQR